MFGRKQAEIGVLREDLGDTRVRRDLYWNNWQNSADALTRKESELSILQEAFRNGVKVTDDLKAELALTKEFLEGAEGAKEEYRNLNQDLRAEAEDLSRMLELYKALVASLRIVIKLPARKK